MTESDEHGGGRTTSDRATYLAYRAGSAVARALPRPVVGALAAGLGTALAVPPSGRRTMLERHLRRVNGDVPEARLRRQVRRTYRSYARYWMESFRLPGRSPAELDARMSWHGLAHLDDALARGAGAIVALPHLGGWDFGGAWLATLGYRSTVVVEPLDPPELFDWFAAFRRSLGLNIVPLGPEAAPALLRALKANEIVGLVSDRDIHGTGVEVEFFGERTTLPSGPATLALRTGAPLIPATIYFRRRGGHLGVIRPPLPAERQGKLRDDVVRVTQTLAHELEDLIRAAPDQWHLMQPNWPSDHAAAP